MQKFIGTGVALVTPFKEDLSVDFIALKKLVNYNIDNGTNYLVINGTTGESGTITDEEKQEIIAVIVAENKGRLPLVLGVGGNNTANVVKELQTRDFSNIDGILSVAPYYSKPTQEGFYQHFKAISEATEKPIILYNVPGRTASNISEETTLRLANDFENIVAVKEASGDMDQIMKIIKNKPSDFVVLSGDDGLTLPMIKMGAEGVISVIGQSHPKEFSEMVKEERSGNSEKANKLHYSLYDFYGPLYAEGNPAGIKATLKLLRVCGDTLRPPLVNVSEKIVSQLKKLLK